jgi:ABC-type proline/glycine betaine transport system ATPase subunit
MRKTILFVTHDAEEAFRLADMIIVMREGEVVQYGTSQEIIIHPQNETVDGLIGGRDVIRQLHTIKAGSVMEPVNGRRGVAGLRLIRLQDDLKTAMAVLLESGANSLGVVDENEEIVGVISWGLIRKIGYDVEHAVDASSLRIEEVVNTKQAL